VANWNPPKVNPFAGLFGQKAQQPKPAEPPRRVSMRAMKAVDLKKLSADDVLEVDEFSLAEAAGEQEDFARDQAQDRAKEQARAFTKAPRKDMPALKAEAMGPPQTARPDALGTVQKLPPRPVDPKFSALVALDKAQDPGVYFVDDSARENHREEEEEDPELREAVEECIRLLFGVTGIHHVGPGRNDKGEPVIVVAAATGFTQESMKAVPERVHRFDTLVALPFDLVPLRRTR